MLLSALGLVLGLLLAGCAPKARFPAGEAILRGEAPPSAAEPESLRAKLELTAYERGRKTTASAAFSAKPRERYKLDVYGLPGMVEASFLWADTGWALVLYGREGYLRGYGDRVDLPGLGIGAAPVHDLFGFLWGDFFPGKGGGAETDAGMGAADTAAGATAGKDSAAGGKTHAAPVGGAGAKAPTVPAGWTRMDDRRVRYRAGGAEWVVELDPATGVVREAGRADSSFRLVYMDYRLRAGRPVPGRVGVFAGTRPLLDIAVEAVEDQPNWSRDPFRLKIPGRFSDLTE